MCLLLQLNSDLPERFKGHERRLYVFACRNKACRKKAGTVRALRGTRISPSNLQKKNAGDEDKQSVQDSSSSSSSSTSTGAQPNLGNSIFAPTSPSVNSQQQNPFTSTFDARQNPFTSNKASSQSFSTASASQPAIQPDKLKTHNLSTPPTTFATKARLAAAAPAAVAKEPWPSESSRPKPYLAYSLDADYETLDPSPPSSLGPKLGTVTDYIHSKDEDREAFESSLDKSFQRFADRLSQNPEQVLRYEFGGVPLLYSKNDAAGKVLSSPLTTAAANSKITTQAWSSSSGIPACQNCGRPRVFEMQLVPQAIAELEAEETGLDGMEWGTIIVGVCSADCEERGIRSGEWGWIE